MTKIRANQAEIEEIFNDPFAAADETKRGAVEIATQAEVDAGTDTLLSITPTTLKNAIVNQGSTLYEPKDPSILKSADIGVTVQGYDATILIEADIGTTGSRGIAATAHNHDGKYEPIISTKNTGFNLNLGTTAGTVSEGNHTHAIGSLSDVVLTGSPALVLDDVLVYNGSNWVHQPKTSVGTKNIEDLNNVVVTGSPATINGEILKYDGMNWVNVVDVGIFTEDASLNIVGGSGTAPVIEATAYGNFITGAGAAASLTTGDDNIVIGRDALSEGTLAGQNIALGFEALKGNASFPMTSATGQNIAIGWQAANKLSTGATQNVAIGGQAGFALASVAGNTLIGHASGINIGNGGDNTVIGSGAGPQISTGSRNVCLGRNSGPTANTSDKLFIDTSQTDTPLIGGDFSAGTVTVTGEMTITGGIVGTSGTTTTAATVDITGGSNPPAQTAGHVNLVGGDANAGYFGGDVTLTPGTGAAGAAYHGDVQVHFGNGTIGQAEIQIWNDTDAGHTTGNYVALKAPSFGSPATNLTLTLPSVDGSNGYVLQTDGVGNLSFVVQSGGIASIVEDTTPQLGGNLDLNGKQLFGDLIVQKAGSPALHVLNIDTANGRVAINGLPNESSGALQVTGDLHIEGGVNYRKTDNTVPLATFMGGTNFFVVRDFADVYTVQSIWSPPGEINSGSPTIEREATLALVRGDEPNQEFVDIYNNGYLAETQFGIRMQKRGTGVFRPFVIDYDDGTTKTPVLTINTDTTVDFASAITTAGGVDKLTTATGVVSVAAATAPTVGQALVATSATVATWQDVTLTTELFDDKSPQLGADLDANTYQIKGTTPVAAADLTRKDYVDDTTVSISGDTMTGDLIIDRGALNASRLIVKNATGGAGVSLGAKTTGQVTIDVTNGTGANTATPMVLESNGDTTFINNAIGITPTLAAHLTRKDYVDDTTVSITGDTMTGDLNFGTNNHIIMGDSGFLDIYNNGSNSVIANTSGGLFIESSAGVTVAAFTQTATKLYFSSAQKLETVTDGLSVTGTVTSDTAPTAISHLTRKDYVDDTTVSITGDTMTGNLTVGNGTSADAVFVKANTGNAHLYLLRNDGAAHGLIYSDIVSDVIRMRKYASNGTTVETDLTLGTDGNVTVNGATPTLAAHLTRKDYVDTVSASRNAIINGNFDIWQRDTSQTTNGYGSDDRWFNGNIGSTKTHSQVTFALGQTAVPYNPTYYSSTAVTSVAGAGNFVLKQHRIENVSTFAGETVTFSFWAKADATKNIATEFAQVFGTGGAPSTNIVSIGVTTHALTTTWQKFTTTVTIPSLSGKTLGTDGNDHLRAYFWFDAGSDNNARTNSLGQQSGTFDIAQVQIERGDIATPFEYKSIADELARCQRYYTQSAPVGSLNSREFTTTVTAWANTNARSAHIPFPVQMRIDNAAIVFYNSEGGTAGQWSYYDGSWFSSTATTRVSNMTQGMQANIVGTFIANTSYLLNGNYTADAEL